MPATFWLVGSASGRSDGLDVTCRLEWLFELQETGRSGSTVRYAGTHGGDVQRTLLDETGAGVSFWADVHGETEAVVQAPGRVEILIPANRGTGSRFWDALGRFDGSLDETGRASGSWTCAPLDVDSGGYVDTTVTVTGSWHTEPI